MGGTSTDVSHYAGELERTFEGEVAGLRLQMPMMQRAHGRGWRRLDASFRRTRARVGPGSAGADPGPAAIGAAGH